MRVMRGRRLPIERCAAAILALSWALPATAQDVTSQASPEGTADEGLPAPEIVVTGTRGSAVTDILPIAELDVDAIAATGAADMPELLRAIRGVTQGADGSEPIFLLNGQRVSGYQDIGALPPEAIEKVEVLPEPAALKFGFPPTRRVVNFITKRRFRQTQLRASAGSTTDPGSGTQKAYLGLVRLHDDRRVTLGLEYRHTDALLQSERDILPDPEIPFDAIGNVTGPGGGEIDPALSALAGELVTIAPVPTVPADRATLAGYAAGANQPRLFDPGPWRTLSPANDTIKAEAVIADRIGKTLSGSISLSAEHSRESALGGPATVRLIVPETNPFSPFSGPVVLNRYLTEADPLRDRKTMASLNAGATLRGAISGWRWDFTGAFEHRQTDGRNERGIDITAANASIAAGMDPFAAFDPALLATRLIDRTLQRTQRLGAKTVVTGSPFRLPAGAVTLIATVEADRATAVSASRGPSPSDLQLRRTRIEGGLAIDLPLASRRENVLSFIGDLSASASINARDVGGFGGLRDSTLGLAWGPIEGVQLLATLKQSEAAPDMTQQSTPLTRVPNVPVFDFANGRTDLVLLTMGGNPDLLAERRMTRSLTLSVKPFSKRELRVAATYDATTIHDQTGTVYAITPQTEAALPDLFVRDSQGRLVAVTYRPINFHREEQRTLNVTVNASGTIGKTPPPPPPGSPRKPQFSYYAGMGPSLKFLDRLQLRPGTPELDLLAGDTVSGGGMSRVYGYAYAGGNYHGFGGNVNLWVSGPNRVRSDDPASDLRFSPYFKLDVTLYLPVQSVIREKWTRGLQFRVEVTNLTDDRPTVRDGNDMVPYRYQRDYLDPIGRTVTLALRKLF